MRKPHITFAASLLLLLLGATFAIAADPNAPEAVGVISSERRSQSTDGFAVPAQAGNVTQLEINDTRISSHWQGYYGTIRGKITLDDASNSTLFDWQLANPSGEVFASNGSSVNWANTTCIDRADGGEAQSNISTLALDGVFNITSTEVDSVNNTFNYTYGDTFDVGDVTIASGDNCPLAYMYVNNASQQTSFEQVLLTDNTSVLFTALLESDATGFDGSAWDFQMIVAENSAPGTTDYYFFVELN